MLVKLMDIIEIFPIERKLETQENIIFRRTLVP